MATAAETVAKAGPLRRPFLVAAFEGWNDAGDAATSGLAHLDTLWDAKYAGELDSEDYYDYTVNRPRVGIEPGSGERRITWPTTRISIARVDALDRDAVLVHGVEPSIRWRSFVAEIVDVAKALDVELVLTLGALLADTPHTRPVPVSGTSNDMSVAERLGFEPSTYEGPTGIVGVLGEACRAAGVPSASLWAAVPHYVSAPPCPKATLALLTRVEDLLEVSLSLDDLAEESRAWQVGVDELAAEDEDVAEYVSQLELARDTADLPEASGEAIAREFERFLRRRTD